MFVSIQFMHLGVPALREYIFAIPNKTHRKKSSFSEMVEKLFGKNYLKNNLKCWREYKQQFF